MVDEWLMTGKPKGTLLISPTIISGRQEALGGKA
jgi:hypothetical protein